MGKKVKHIDLVYDDVMSRSIRFESCEIQRLIINNPQTTLLLDKDQFGDSELVEYKYSDSVDITLIPETTNDCTLDLIFELLKNGFIELSITYEDDSEDVFYYEGETFEIETDNEKIHISTTSEPV